jgi:hypothetical protein
MNSTGDAPVAPGEAATTIPPSELRRLAALFRLRASYLHCAALRGRFLSPVEHRSTCRGLANAIQDDLAELRWLYRPCASRAAVTG